MIERGWYQWIAILANIAILKCNGYVTYCYNGLGNTVSCGSYINYCKMTVTDGDIYTYSGGCASSCTDSYSTTQITYCCVLNNCNTVSVAKLIADDNFNPSDDESSSDNSNSSNSSLPPWYFALVIAVPILVCILIALIIGPIVFCLMAGAKHNRQMKLNARPYGPWYDHVRQQQSVLGVQPVVTIPSSGMNGTYSAPALYNSSTYAQPGVYSMPAVDNSGMYGAYNPQSMSGFNKYSAPSAPLFTK